MKKLLLTVVLCMIGFNAFALELRCAITEIKYVKTYTSSGALYENSKESMFEKAGEWVSIFDDYCKAKGFRFKLKKTDEQYRCSFNMGNKKKTVFDTIIIDRYTGKAEFYKEHRKENRVSFEQLVIRQCEKPVRKF